MTEMHACLSKKVLDQIGRDEILPHELQRIEGHVSECEQCRLLFTSAIDDSDWSDRILPVLRERSWETPTAVKSTQSRAQDSALSLLGPTDDPRMLGRIGPYEVIGVIGHGGMGVVFKAFDASLNRYVAIKMMLPHLATSGAARKRFSREGQAAAAVIDDHVLPIYGVDEWRGAPYIVTQYSNGMSLQKRIHDQAPMPLKEILRISLQAARGLAAAHAQGLVHRDVKPSNILLDGTVERALLTDFGLARAVDDASITRSGTITGTPQFMAPEQARGEAVDQRSDLFSLGAVIYAMCTGHPPFRAETSYGVLRRITDDEPSDISEINPEIPAWLCQIVAKLMAKDREERYVSASVVAEQLEACLAHLQQPATVPLPDDLQPHHRREANRFADPRTRLATVSAISVIVLVGFLAVIVTRPNLAIRWLTNNTGNVNDQVKNNLPPVHAAASSEDSPTTIAALEEKLAGLNDRVHLDFIQEGAASDLFVLSGDNGTEQITSQRDGLHVIHSGTLGYSSSSVETQIRVHGNFEITASFENFYFDSQDNGSGAISLTVILDNVVHTHGGVQRGALSEIDKPLWHFIQSEFARSPERAPGVLWLGTTAEEARSGQLRLARDGELLYCLFAANESNDFRLLQAERVGAESLLFGGVRLVNGVQSNGATHGTASVTWNELTIRAERITDRPVAE